MLPAYEFQTKPFDHQARLFEETRERAAFAVLWEQGTGKTKPTIDLAADLYERGEIDAVVLVAPNGVHRNWKSDELPLHLPKRLHNSMRVEFWDTQKAGNKGYKAKMKALKEHKGFSWILFSYNGFMTANGKKYAWQFLRDRRCLFILDEAHNIAKPGAKRTKSIVAASKYAKWRRILTGTPVATGPFDLYSQIKFLDEGFWKRYGLDNFTVFKFHFGNWFTADDCKRLHGYDPGYDKLVDYKNIEQLEEILKSVSDRVLKEDVLDLPPKLYSKRYYELNSEQTRVYNDLKETYEAEFEDGARVEGNLAIVRLLRLHQVLCGYAYTEVDDENAEPARVLGNNNPLLDAIEEEASGISHQGIIWARFRKDIDQLCERFGKKARRYDGAIGDDECERNKLDFQRGEYQWFIGNAQKGGSGLTLNQAKTMFYASQSFRFIDRLQSEDRFHRLGQDVPVNIVDFEGLLPDGRKTVAYHIIKNLRQKYDIASRITGDQLREWI